MRAASLKKTVNGLKAAIEVCEPELRMLVGTSSVWSVAAETILHEKVTPGIVLMHVALRSCPTEYELADGDNTTVGGVTVVMHG